jgi:Ran GTPase-activating protein (RanGAP) involved in mRNA processing and transport
MNFLADPHHCREPNARVDRDDRRRRDQAEQDLPPAAIRGDPKAAFQWYMTRAAQLYEDVREIEIGALAEELDLNAEPHMATQYVEALLAKPPKPPHSCPQVTTLWLQGKELNDECAEVLAYAMRRGDVKHLTDLVLGINSISPRGMCTIASAISQSALPALRSLNLHRNPILDEGFAALCAVASHIPLLQTVELMECGLTAAGAWALAAAAKAGNMRNLQSAYLRGNQLGDVGLKALCEALAEPKVNASAVEGAGFPKLQCVHLSDNQIGDDGCLALAEAIEAGHVDHVRLIQMSNNVQTRDGFEVVHDALEEFEKKRLIQVHF